MATKQKAKKSTTRHRNKSKLFERRVLRPIAAAMIVLGGLAGGLQASTNEPQVLAYATGVSISGLTSSTNQARAANGIAGLTNNSLLNNAAQAKAADMVAKDYWAHTSPDGTQPWAFILAAGYSYQTAGENLAYGAITSQQTVDAWMNSEGHRANVLNAKFTEVGFGFLNAENFVGSGEQTVIVAMYAAPYAAPAPEPAPTPAPTPSVQSSQSTPQQTTPSEPAKPKPEPVDEKEPVKEQEASEPVPSTEEQGDVKVVQADPDTVRRVEALSGIYAPWLVGSVAVGGVGASGTFLYTHSRRWHRWIIKGERFVAHHVVFDMAVLALAVLAYVMLQAVATIL